MAPCENAITYEGAVELLLSNRFVEAESTFKKVRRKCDEQGGAKRVGEFALGGFGLIDDGCTYLTNPCLASLVRHEKLVVGEEEE